jgi:hypothetical protein
MGWNLMDEVSTGGINLVVSLLSGIVGAIVGGWFTYFLTKRSKENEKKTLEKSYFTELERERDILVNQLRKLWNEYSYEKQATYTTGYWGNYDFVESLAIEGIKYGIPLWGAQATLRSYLRSQNTKINDLIKQRNEQNKVFKMLEGEIDFWNVAGELRQQTGVILFRVIAPLSHCVTAIKEKDKFILSKDFDEGSNLEKIFYLTGLDFDRKTWEIIFEQFGKKIK